MARDCVAGVSGSRRERKEEVDNIDNTEDEVKFKVTTSAEHAVSGNSHDCDEVEQEGEDS